jgi:hypothetical protein
MCAFFLLNEDKNANKQLQNLLEQDYMNFFRFSEWPALPKDCLSGYRLQMYNAA